MATNSKEHWVEVEGYPQYLVSSLGRVRNWKSGLEIKPRFSPARGLFVYLWCDGENCLMTIHDMMAEAFFFSCGDEGHDSVIKHRDGDITNNTLQNLMIRSRRPAPLPRQGNPGDIRIVETGETFPTGRAVAAHLGGVSSGVSEALNGNRPHYKGYHFERVS